MNKKNYQLPNMELKFEIQMVGEETGLNWAGKFLYRRPTLGERAQIDVMKARLNNDLKTVDIDTTAFHEAISHLRFTIKEYPEWWAELDFGGRMYDPNVVLEIYNKCIEFEAEWRSKVHGGESKTVEPSNENKDPTRITVGES